MTYTRDKSPEKTKKILQEKVANRCSNPGCNCLTSGPNYDAEKATRIGVAAHITAAFPNGPRFNPSLSGQERKHISNGIWLCQNCAKLISSDELTYTEHAIRSWKSETESRIRHELEGRNLPVDDIDLRGWPCGHCITFVAEGQMVCTVCQAGVAYQATKYEVLEARKVGGLFGAIVGGVLNFGVPNFLNSHFNLNIPSDWELGLHSLFIIAAPAIIGAKFFRRS